jgi:hypothetical protein
LDGNAGFVTGELRLYVNGTRVGTVVGAGAIYQNPNDPPGFGQGYLTSYTGYSKTINPELVTPFNATNSPLVLTNVAWDEPLNGVIDEFAYINQGTLSDARIAQLYSFSQTNWAATGFSIVTNNPTGNPPSIAFTLPSGGFFNLSWPSSASNYFLEYTTNLASGIWISNPMPPTTINGTNVVTQGIGTNSSVFFRLAQ